MLRSASHELSSRGRSSETSGVAASASHAHARPTTGLGSSATGASARAWRGTSRSTSRPRLAHSNVGLQGLVPSSFSGGSGAAEYILPSPSEAFARFPTAVHQPHAEQEEVRPYTAATVTRSSTSRSRSRAPDQLKGLLAREREAASSSGGATLVSRDGSPSVGAAAEGEAEEEAEQWWQRGRGREVRAARGAGGSESSTGGAGKKSSRWPWQA